MKSQDIYPNCDYPFSKRLTSVWRTAIDLLVELRNSPSHSAPTSDKCTYLLHLVKQKLFYHVSPVDVRNSMFCVSVISEKAAGFSDRSTRKDANDFFFKNIMRMDGIGDRIVIIARMASSARRRDVDEVLMNSLQEWHDLPTFTPELNGSYPKKDLMKTVEEICRVKPKLPEEIKPTAQKVAKEYAALCHL